MRTGLDAEEGLELGGERPIVAKELGDLASGAQAAHKHQHARGDQRCQRVRDVQRVTRVGHGLKHIRKAAKEVLHRSEKGLEQGALLEFVLVQELFDGGRSSR